MTSTISASPAPSDEPAAGRMLAGVGRSIERLVGRSGSLLLVGSVVMFTMAALSLVYARGGEPLAVFWPAGGALLALCLGFPAHKTPWLLAGAMLGNLAAELMFTYDPAVKSLGLALCHVGEVGLAASIMRRFGGDQNALKGRWLYILGLTAAGVSVVFSALAGIVLAAAGEFSSIAAVSSRWVLAESLGILVVTPPVAAADAHTLGCAGQFRDLAGGFLFAGVGSGCRVSADLFPDHVHDCTRPDAGGGTLRGQRYGRGVTDHLSCVHGGVGQWAGTVGAGWRYQPDPARVHPDAVSGWGRHHNLADRGLAGRPPRSRPSSGG
ncbi:MAG: MASE1 domain-containing protein [Brevundimonas sp.]|nr:MAG: MASE1 domain-containing protein [Brevundimonas sp.]